MVSGRKASKAEDTACANVGSLKLDTFSGLEVQSRWNIDSMPRNAGGKVDVAVGHQTLKDLDDAMQRHSEFTL